MPAAGVCNYGTATLDDCTISGNSSNQIGGGGVNNGEYATATLNDCTISGNSTSGGGGGVYVNFGTTTLTNCTISGNSADAGGGVDNFATAMIDALHHRRQLGCAVRAAGWSTSVARRR